MSTRMETTFYDDPLHAFSQHEPAGFGSYGHQHHHPRPLKHALTLDLHADPPGGLKPHPLRARAGQELLTSPDVGLLRLGSPELERLIIQSGHGLVTTTPTPTQFLCPRDVTDAQEGFAEGFVRALAELHHAHMPGGAPAAAAVSALPPPSDPAPPAGSGVNSAAVPPSPAPSSSTSSSSSSSSTSPPGYGHHGPLRSDSPVYEDLDTFHASLISTVSAPGYTASPPAAGSFSQPPPPPMYGQQLHLKEEPQTVPEMPGDTPPLSPINMESQERIKAERKRMRNRIAASKCRKRKLERISRLEDKVKNLKNQNSELSSTANGLREQVALLKQKVMNHVNSGCQLMLTQQLQTF